MFGDGENIIEFKPNYPHTLPRDWKDKNNPTIYEISATLDTLKSMYVEQVIELEEGLIDFNTGEEILRNIATNYQNIKAILFQPR